MAENKMVGSLVLKTIDIDPTRVIPTQNSPNMVLSNDFGLCDANGSFITWRNVNIRECLGGLYHKYKNLI